MRILIANRGEIARRVIRTAHRLGHTTVAAFADPDRDAPFAREATVSVRLGPADLAESYLSIERLLDVAATTGADAVHPGYGFLSEHAGFARAVVDAGLTWIGPDPGVIAAMGSKIEARRLATAAGVPVIPGYDESQDPDDLAAAARRIGFPVLVKAAAGGGGKGIRIVSEPSAFASALAEATSEAERSFGDRSVIVERYVQRPRHVEVQIVGDRHGGVAQLGTRECSVQRRYQKLLEEAPAPNLPETTRDGLHDAAVTLARSIGYDSVGTVEFVVDDETGDHYFLEMNTRLQVEHPVTEWVTGLDLVELQLRSAAGEPLPPVPRTTIGHAFEVRINAEDATAGFVPQIGTVTGVRVPADARWDSAVEPGTVVTPHYDPLIAKLIVGGDDRDSARRRLAAALDELLLAGIVTNTGFHRWLVDQPPVAEGRVTTRFLDEATLPGPPEPAVTEAALAWRAAVASAAGRDAWRALGPFRLTPHRDRRPVVLRALDGELHEVELDPDVDAAWRSPSQRHVEIARGGLRRGVPAAVDTVARSVAVNVAGHTHSFTLPDRSERWSAAAARGHGHADAVVAPFPAVVVELLVAPGEELVAGDPVAVIEAMKMLHTLTAVGPGAVDQIRVVTGEQVPTGHVLVTFHDRPRDDRTGDPDGAPDDPDDAPDTPDGAPDDPAPRPPGERSGDDEPSQPGGPDR